LNGLVAQRLSIDTSDKVWAVPGNGIICILDYDVHQAVGLTCDSNENAVAHGVIMTRIADGDPMGSAVKRVMFGIVPDGVRAAYIHTGATVAAVPVTGNVFFRQDSVPKPPDRVSIR
jgi:hypothetical protein